MEFIIRNVKLKILGLSLNKVDTIHESKAEQKSNNWTIYYITYNIKETHLTLMAHESLFKKKGKEKGKGLLY